ncbi:MAG: hypothetical protein Ct9H90mP13_13680 [Pseudomonadota bacterium]|nr:MAG: hypothetical protein Ct9H90mP13_13680 [Pseudomonadota bacterium]
MSSIRFWVSSLIGSNTKDLVVSVAGPKNGDSITMTNRNWKIVSSEVKESLD